MLCGRLTSGDFNLTIEAMNSKIQAWLHGLCTALVTGIGNGISLFVVDATFDIFKDTTGLLQAAAATTLISIGAYLKQSPLPFYDFEGGKEASPPVVEIKAAQEALKRAGLIVIGFFLMFSTVSCVSPVTGKIDVKATAENAKPFLRPSAAAIGIGAIMVTKENESKADRAEWLNSIATQIKLVTSSTPPSATELRAAMMKVTPQGTDDLVQVVITITTLYSGVKARFGENTQVVLEAINEIALGLQDAAAPYIKKSSSGIFRLKAPNLLDEDRSMFENEKPILASS